MVKISVFTPIPFQNANQNVEPGSTHYRNHRPLADFHHLMATKGSR